MCGKKNYDEVPPFQENVVVVRRDILFFMVFTLVDLTGLEPVTFSMSMKRSSQLSYRSSGGTKGTRTPNLPAIAGRSSQKSLRDQRDSNPQPLP